MQLCDTHSRTNYFRAAAENFVLTTNVDHQFQLAGFDKKEFFTHRVIMDYGNAASHVTKRPMIMKKQ